MFYINKTQFEIIGEKMTENKISQTPSFKAYLKFKAKPRIIDKLIDLSKEETSDILFINRKKGKKEDTIYLLSGKHFNKFIDLLQKTTSLRTLRNSLTKKLHEKPKEMNAQEVIEAILQNKFKFKKGEIK